MVWSVEENDTDYNRGCHKHVTSRGMRYLTIPVFLHNRLTRRPPVISVVEAPLPITLATVGQGMRHREH